MGWWKAFGRMHSGAVSVSSAVYPLAEYYESRAAEWIAVFMQNPLSSEIVDRFRTRFQSARAQQRKLVTDFLRSHGYEPGMFEKYGARDLNQVEVLLEG